MRTSTSTGSFRPLKLLTVAVLLLGLVAACGGDGETTADGAAETTADSAAEAVADDDASPAGGVDGGIDDEAGADAAAAAEATAAVEIDGDPIVAMPDDLAVTDLTTDPAAGTVAPTLSGTDFAGNDVTIEADGRAKAVYFLAHWCPHCQDEVPVVQGLIDDGSVPEGLDLYAVSTAVDAGRDNYPPDAWLEREGFDPVTVRDDDAASLFRAYGGSGFPYVVYLDAEHRVVARSAGNLPEDAILSLWGNAIGGG